MASINHSQVDLHMHTTFSDGSDSASELISHLKENQMQIFAVTDHDTVGGIAEVAALVPPEMTFIPGIEFSAITKYREAHILGYGYDIQNETFQKAIEDGRQKRKIKLDHRLKYLKDTFDITFSQEDVDYLYSLNSVAKPHLGLMLMKYGYAENISEGITKYINGCKVDNDRIDYRDAINAIHAAGGIAVWAHPLGGENVRHFEKWELERQLDLIAGAGIDGLECYYSRYSLEEVQLLLEEARSHHLLISGGSDYHGTNKTIAMGTLNSAGKIVTKDQLTVLDRLMQSS